MYIYIYLGGTVKKSKYTPIINLFFETYGPTHHRKDVWINLRSLFNDNGYNSTDYSFEYCAKKILNSYSIRESFEEEGIICKFESPTSIEVGSIFCTSKVCFSHLTALYLNELTNQRPEDIFLSREVTQRKSQHSNEYNALKVELAFMKKQRHVAPHSTILKRKYYITSKVDLNFFDTNKIERLSGLKKRTMFTGVNRTLVDCIVSPQYGGGYRTISNSLSSADINIYRMKEYYDMNNFFYPYWQRIGFLLERYKSKKVAEDWKKLFYDEELEVFYIDKGFRKDWTYDEEWKIYYPGGLF